MILDAIKNRGADATLHGLGSILRNGLSQGAQIGLLGAQRITDMLDSRLAESRAHDERFAVTAPATTDAPAIIVGAGPCGLSAASALADAGIRSIVLEREPLAKIAAPAEDGREIALTHRGMAILQRLGAWNDLSESEITPLKAAKVFNAKDKRSLDFCATDDIGRLGSLVPNHCLRRIAYAGVQRRTDHITLMCEQEIKSFDLEPDKVAVRLAKGKTLHGQLLIAADSRFSNSRRSAGIGADMLDFGRSVILCRLRHEQANQLTAFECFHNGHTIAWLPLAEHVSSLVLTIRSELAQQLMQLNPADFLAWISEHAQDQLGTLEYAEPQAKRHFYPLVATYAHRFFARRFALLGDAAVGMHPVTAHGYNFGLYGVETLVDELTRARRQLFTGRVFDAGDPRALSRFHSRHRKATRAIYLGTNAVVNLFTDDSRLTQALRQAVIAGTAHLSPLQKLITHQLTGNTMMAR